MKYIDADFLRKKIEKLKKEYDARVSSAFMSEGLVYMGKVEAINNALRIIDSLQQEQESVAEQFAKIVRANLSEIGKNAQSQFEQLYFEITGTKMYGGYND